MTIDITSLIIGFALGIALTCFIIAQFRPTTAKARRRTRKPRTR